MTKIKRPRDWRPPCDWRPPSSGNLPPVTVDIPMPAVRPPSPGNVPITITRGVPITIRVGNTKITIEEEQGHEVKAGSKIQT